MVALGGRTLEADRLLISTGSRILGVHVIGGSAPEIIHDAATAMHFRATINDFVGAGPAEPQSCCIV